MPTQPISADALGTYLPAMLIPAVDLTQPVGSRNIKLNASSFLGVLTTTFSIQASATDGTIVGGNTRGNYAVDLQGVSQRSAATQVASGANALTVGSGNTASGAQAVAIGLTNVASTPQSVAIGASNTASGNQSVAIGNGNTASLNNATAIGNSNTASGAASTCLGQLNLASATYSVVMGGQASDRGTFGSLCFGSGNFAAAGDAQQRNIVLRGATTTATPARLTADGTGTASAANIGAVSVNGTYRIQGWIVVNEAAVAAKEWSFNALIRTGATAATTVLVGSAAVNTYGDAALSACTVTLTVDTTFGGLNVTVTGIAATTLHWVCRFETVEAV